MKTEEEYFKDAREEQIKEAQERRVKWRAEIEEEIKDWDTDKLIEEYIKSRLARISYHNPANAGILWDMFHSQCTFCALEFMYGDHEDCCDDCWEKNKDKTLEEIENE